MNKHLKAYFDKQTNVCIVCGQYVGKDIPKEGVYKQSKHAMEHVRLEPCKIFEGKGK
jgi:hypothetical protein